MKQSRSLTDRGALEGDSGGETVEEGAMIIAGTRDSPASLAGSTSEPKFDGFNRAARCNDEFETRY